MIHDVDESILGHRVEVYEEAAPPPRRRSTRRAAPAPDPAPDRDPGPEAGASDLDGDWPAEGGG